MISVQNLRLRLNGNRWLTCWLAVLLFAAGCTPKIRVLRAPDDKTKPRAETPKGTEKKEEKTDPEPENVEANANQIALLLPFELDKANPHAPSAADIKRSALALDFYQGFKVGLDALAAEGANFRLNVLDTRDDPAENTRIAKLDAVQQAALVVGPVFPKEIQVFGFNAALEDALQVSPLAATTPAEYNLPNLVTITPPLTAHVKALAAYIAEQYRKGDVVVLYNTQDGASRQFLAALKTALKQAKGDVEIAEVQDQESLESSVRLNGANLVVVGTANQYQLAPILGQLRRLQEELSHEIRLFGHPNWTKLDFGEEEELAALTPYVTTSYYIDQGDSQVREFDRTYRQEFGVAPTEFAYKGFDAARYFGGLLEKYGTGYKAHIVDESYKGLHNTFRFEHNPAWGYVNNAISILQYRNGRFSPVN